MRRARSARGRTARRVDQPRRTNAIARAAGHYAHQPFGTRRLPFTRGITSSSAASERSLRPWQSCKHLQRRRELWEPALPANARASGIRHSRNISRIALRSIRIWTPPVCKSPRDTEGFDCDRISGFMMDVVVRAIMIFRTRGAYRASGLVFTAGLRIEQRFSVPVLPVCHRRNGFAIARNSFVLPVTASAHVVRAFMPEHGNHRHVSASPRQCAHSCSPRRPWQCFGSAAARAHLSRRCAGLSCVRWRSRPHALHG